MDDSKMKQDWPEMNDWEEDFRAEFVISGFSESPEELTRKIGLQPTKTATKGQKFIFSEGKPGHRIAKKNMWFLSSALPVSAHIDEHITSLIEIMRPHQKELISAAERAEESYWSLFGSSYIISGLVGIWLDRKLVREMMVYPSGLDIDVYHLPKEVTSD